MKGVRGRYSTWFAAAALVMLGVVGLGGYLSGVPVEVQAAANAHVSMLAQNATATPATQATVNVARLNVRAGPGTANRRLAGVKRGDVLQVIGQTRACQWLKVVTPNKATGWVLGSYVTLNDPCGAVPLVATPVPATRPQGQQAPVLLPAPAIVGPAPDASLDLPVAVLEWSPVKQPLGPDEYYIVQLQFKHGNETWTDYAYTRETRWPVLEHAYLADLSSDGRFDWTVRLIRATGRDDKGVPQGIALSQSSVQRKFILNRRNAPPEQPTPPDCGGYCPELRRAPGSSELLTTFATLGFGLMVGMVLVVGWPIRRKNDN